jgi:hypothetical protein
MTPILKRERQAIAYSAHYTVAREIRLGHLAHPRLSPCADCGGVATEYDHRDYTKPLKVDPVCRGCNARRGPALVWTTDGRMPIGRIAAKSKALPASAPAHTEAA